MKTNATKTLSNGMQCDWMIELQYIEENNTKIIKLRENIIEINRALLWIASSFIFWILWRMSLNDHFFNCQKSYQEECQHVNNESENDDRISSSLCQEVTENSEQKAAGYFADANHDSVKSDLKTKILILDLSYLRCLWVTCIKSAVSFHFPDSHYLVRS